MVRARLLAPSFIVGLVIPGGSVWEQRYVSLRRHATQRLLDSGVSVEQLRRLTREVSAELEQAVAKTRTPPSEGYFRRSDRAPSRNTLGSAAVLRVHPITLALFRQLALCVGTLRPWQVGYVLALLLLEDFDQATDDADAEYPFAEDDPEHGADGGLEWIEDNLATVEIVIGKAEEAVYKADVLAEDAAHGEKSKRPADTRWEARVVAELNAIGPDVANYRFKRGSKKAGELNTTALAKRLHARILGSDRPEPNLPSEKTLRRRLRLILPAMGIALETDE
jgi:hypothetical protein